MKNSNYFLSYQYILLFINFFILKFFFPVGGLIDLSLIQPWVSHSGEFLFRDSWYLAKLNHSYIKDIIMAVYICYFMGWLSSFKCQKLKMYQMKWGYFFLVSLLCTSIVGLIKSQSAYACPWNMTIPSVSGFTWDFSAKNGHCFPGGHASTGFALVTGYFVYRLSNIKKACFFLVAGLILGFAMGWAQMMRGAHFLSHNLWTLWICWCVNVLIYQIILKYSPQILSTD